MAMLMREEEEKRKGEGEEQMEKEEEEREPVYPAPGIYHFHIRKSIRFIPLYVPSNPEAFINHY